MITITQAQAVAGSAFNSAPFDLGDNLSFSVSCDFSGSTLAGTGKLQGSNDKVEYVDLTATSGVITQTIASAASVLLGGTSIPHQYVRMVWTPSSGSGTAALTVKIKEPNKGYK